MGISEKKTQIVINNYFKQECDVNTSIRAAFEKGFRIGIKKASSAKPDWIPCSVRLPEKEGCYLVTVKNDYKRKYSKTAWYSGDGWFARQDIIAWRPLPEEYKAEEEE